MPAMQRMRALPALPTGQVPLQGLQVVELLLARLAEQDQGQFGGDQGVGAGVMALLHLLGEIEGPIVQAAVRDTCLRAEQRGQFGDIEKL